jgi:hypothetical protein
MSEQREVHVDTGEKRVPGTVLTHDGQVIPVTFVFEKRSEPTVIIDERLRKSRRSDEWPPRKRGKS